MTLMLFKERTASQTLIAVVACFIATVAVNSDKETFCVAVIGKG